MLTLEAYGRVSNTRPVGRKDLVAKGITKGVNQNADVSLMTREFAARIQIISLLKTGKRCHTMWYIS
jgi:hypothetical protein